MLVNDAVCLMIAPSCLKLCCISSVIQFPIIGWLEDDAKLF